MIYILSGPVHSGKTTFLEKSLSRWAGRGLGLAGFLSIAVLDKSGETVYDLLDLKEGRRLPYLRRSGEPGWEKVGPFSFVPSSLEIARNIVTSLRSGELLIVDEVGPLELSRGGLWPALEKVLPKPETRALLVVREEILEDVVKLIGPPVPLVFDVRDPNLRLILDGSLFGTQKINDGKG